MVCESTSVEALPIGFTSQVCLSCLRPLRPRRRNFRPRSALMLRMSLSVAWVAKWMENDGYVVPRSRQVGRTVKNKRRCMAKMTKKIQLRVPTALRMWLPGWSWVQQSPCFLSKMVGVVFCLDPSCSPLHQTGYVITILPICYPMIIPSNTTMARHKLHSLAIT